MAGTYRVQLGPDFTLDDAAAIVPYLNALGVSHLYVSPFFQATPGSTHGYDVVDYHQVNSELGGMEALERLQRALNERGMGLVLDMVPNHMAIHLTNPWWWDVLTHGPSSRYASYFDVEWSSGDGRTAQPVLAPVLGDQYGVVLEAGEIRLAYDEQVFTVAYGDQVFPVDPGTLDRILGPAASRSGSAELAFLAGAFGRLPDSTSLNLVGARRRSRDSQVLADLLARLVREDPAVKEAIVQVTAEMNADADALDAFLSLQNYRLAFWKLSASELGYRRFFDINTMIGLRMDDEEVYHDTHTLVMNLLARGQLDGLRIDHPDGLADPRRYLERLRRDAPQAWIVVEKILTGDERLPGDWPVDGTTGYDFLNRVNGLFVDPEGEQPFSALYAQFTGFTQSFEELVHEKKLQAANDLLGSDLNWLTDLFARVTAQRRRYRDTSRVILREVLAETAAALPVYRTYFRPDQNPRNLPLPSGNMQTTTTAAAVVMAATTLNLPGKEPPEKPSSRSEEGLVMQSIKMVKERRPDLDSRLLDFLADLLTLKERGEVEDELVRRFQQFSGPLMAKGVEDTAFYLYLRLVSLNEVGGDPDRFGYSPQAFHRVCEETQARWPLGLLTTATHDTKRGEDVRARLNVLSEIPGEWEATVKRWSELTARHHVGAWPDRNTEYLIYQTLVGAWPLTEERLLQYLEKAGREAKQDTSWTEPNPEYEAAVAGFARALLNDPSFISELEALVERVKEPGWINSLAQALLKMTAPGIPDLYQGTELWDRSLVDPDNRQAVDYARRRAMISALEGDVSPETVWAGVEDGLPKLWVIRQTLGLRRAYPEWFGPQAAYIPLRDTMAEELAVQNQQAVAVTGGGDRPPGSEEADRAGGLEENLGDEPVVAYLRGDQVLVAVPRLTLRYQERWGEFALNIPPGRWRNIFTQEEFTGGPAALDQLWRRFPVALLVRDDGEGAANALHAEQVIPVTAISDRVVADAYDR